MIEYTVNRKRVIKYLHRYNFNDPEDFFLTTDGTDGTSTYSISSTDLEYSLSKLTLNLKDNIEERAARHVISEINDKIQRSAIDDLLFIICYIAVFNGVGVTNNQFSNVTEYNLAQLIETAIMLKNKKGPRKMTITYGEFDNEVEYLIPTTYLQSQHYLIAIAKLLHLNESDETVKAILNPMILLEDLKIIRQTSKSLMVRKKDIKKSVILMLRDFLESELEISRGRALHISLKQAIALYPIFEFLKWQKKFEDTKSYDRLRNAINRTLELTT